MDLYMDEKWKLSSSKKGSRSCNASRRAMAAAEQSGHCFLRGSASTRERVRTSSFSSRFASLVKEQRARFYIMRRCVTMLICWRDYA